MPYGDWPPIGSRQAIFSCSPQYEGEPSKMLQLPLNQPGETARKAVRNQQSRTRREARDARHDRFGPVAETHKQP